MPGTDDLRRAIAARAGSTLLREASTGWSGEAVLAQVHCRQQLLDALGGARVALALDNSADWVLWDLALLFSGRVAVPVPGFFSPAQQRHLLDSAGVDTLVGASAEDAARQIDECIERIEQGEQRSHFAEVLRLRGWLHGLEGDRANAERLLHRAIALARSQEARSWELRAATTLAELLERDGETEAALATVKPVHDWFSEGFGTCDLQAAARLIARLSGTPLSRAEPPPPALAIKTAS